MIQAILTDALNNGPRLTANVDIQPDKIALSIGGREVAWLETKHGTPRLIVFAENSDHETHIIPIEPHKTRCIQVEYDLEFYGGDYNKVGQFAYVPVDDIGHTPDAIEVAFEKVTGHKRVHIIHYCPDETFDEEGKPWRE